MESFLKKYIAICYRLIGVYFDREKDEDLQRLLYQADMEMTPGMFISFCLITSLISAIFVFIISFVVVSLIIT